LNPSGSINGPVVGSSERSMETYFLIEKGKKFEYLIYRYT